MNYPANMKNDIGDVIDLMLNDKNIKTITVLQEPYRTRVRVTANKVKDVFLINIGRPNFLERKFLNECKKAKCKPRRFWIKYFRKLK